MKYLYFVVALGRNGMLTDVAVDSRVITPNGDGSNDRTSVDRLV